MADLEEDLEEEDLEVEELLTSLHAKSHHRSKRKRNRTLTVTSYSIETMRIELLQPTVAEFKAENVQLHLKNRQMETDFNSLQRDYHDRGLVNQLRGIIKFQKKLKWMVSTRI